MSGARDVGVLRVPNGVLRYPMGSGEHVKKWFSGQLRILSEKTLWCDLCASFSQYQAAYVSLSRTLCNLDFRVPAHMLGRTASHT